MHMEVPRLGVKTELQPPAYATATATQDWSCICNLHHSSRPRQILNPPRMKPASSWIRIGILTGAPGTHVQRNGLRLPAPNPRPPPPSPLRGRGHGVCPGAGQWAATVGKRPQVTRASLYVPLPHTVHRKWKARCCRGRSAHRSPLGRGATRARSYTA